MAKNDFQRNKLSFRVSDFTDLFKKVIDLYLDDLSQHIQNIVMGEIWLNGNGSVFMKLAACALVKETKREITKDSICLEVGIDTDELKGKSERAFVIASVVLHGNMQGSAWTWRDARTMYTKPGVATWGKNVDDKRVHVPAGQQPRAMPGFAQQDVMADIINGITKNSQQQIQKYVDIFVRNVNNALSDINWSAFTEVG